MIEQEVETFPVMGYNEKGEQLPDPIGYLTPTDLEVINRSRGTIKDPNGFGIKTEDITEIDFEEIDVSNYQSYSYPQPRHEWEKRFGRVKKLKWIPQEQEIMMYYNDIDKICYLHNLLKKTVKKYYFEKTEPTDQELLEFQMLQKEYINFLKENDIDVEITSQGEMMNSFKIIDRWSHTDKVDVFSRITEDQRKNIILSRWIGATTWMPAIFTQIKGFLRLGQSVDEKGPFGTGRKPLIDVQGEALRRRSPSSEDEGGWGQDMDKR